MPPRIDDKWLWLGFAAFFYVAAKGLRYAIRDTIELTRVPPSHYEIKTADANEQPEDTISLQDLRILAESPNYNISNSAINIIVSRFRKLPNVGGILCKDLDSDKEDVRRRAKIAARFLLDHGVRIGTLPRDVRATSESSSPADMPPSGTLLSAAELARRLGDRSGGVNGGDAWVGEFIPSASDPVAGWTNVPRERPVDGDSEELERRRRRREAMVLHEGMGALREDDIIRPRD